ncbi:ribonuclease P protein component [Pseudaestuariivita sp.]|uniref:ribonuclease P protein component n=1 Tax=Pseudaestuariivita sp. TaxID=2211669 RepID=UPI004059F28E
MEVLRKRSQFFAAARGRKAAMPSMIVQMRPRNDESPHIGIGFTCSKKVGNAVARNRAKRRLREVARDLLPRDGRPGHDYVLIGRADVTGQIAFADLKQDLKTALSRLHLQRA